MTQNNIENNNVDQVVEDLKYQVRVLSDEKSDFESQHEGEDSSFYDKAIKSLQEMIDAITDKYQDIKNSAKLNEFLEDIELKSSQLSYNLKLKLKEYSENEKVELVLDKAKEITNDASEKISSAIENSEEIQKGIEYTKDTIEKGKEFVADKIDEIKANPEVQEKIQNAKTKTIEIAELAVDKLKKLLKVE